MRTNPPGGKQCQQILDPYGRHAACCAKGLHTRRQASQLPLNRPCSSPDQLQQDGQPAPGNVRPIHRVDVHIIEPPGSELWLDVKTHTINPDHAVAEELLREQLTKCRACGQRDGFNLQALDKGMTPLVLEQFGQTAPGAQAVFNRIILHRSLSDKVSPPLSRNGPPAPNCGVQSHARSAPSSLASPCGVCPSNQPGRLREHARQLAQLFRGVTVNSVSASVAGAWPESFARGCAKRLRRQLTTQYDFSRQIATLCDTFLYFMTISIAFLTWHETS